MARRRLPMREAEDIVQEDEQASAGSPARRPPARPPPRPPSKGLEKLPSGAALEWLMMLTLLLYFGYLVHLYQSERLPAPLSRRQAGVRGFSEDGAREHVVALTEFGPRPVGSDELNRAILYVYSKLLDYKDATDEYVNFEVDLFEPKPGVERLSGPLFAGKSLVYATLKHLVVRLSPADVVGSKKDAILVSSHIDTVITSSGAGDCGSCISVMLELVRALSHWASGFEHSIIFLFNTGEEEGLVGAHSFMTQHPWRTTIRAAIDVESLGTGGRSLLFQAGPDKWLLNLYAKVAKNPAAQVIAQDVFSFGIVKSATDFQVFREVRGLSGLDFLSCENGPVYHTKNDKIEFLREGSLQHIGDELLALLRAAARSDELEFAKTNLTGTAKMEMVYFDILGKWLITFPLSTAKAQQLSLIVQGLMLLVTSLYLSGVSGFCQFGLALVTIGSTWIFAVVCVLAVAVTLPLASAFPIPYIAHPWLVVGLFGAPALFGALLGHALGRHALVTYLRKQKYPEENVRWHAERWLFKAGIFQWLIVLALGTWVEAGSSYLAVVWILPPAIAYGVFEAQFSEQQRLRGLLRSTLWLSIAPGVVITAVVVIRLPAVFIGNLVRLDRNPGSVPGWAGNVSTGILISAYICLMLVYLLPYTHRSGGLGRILLFLTAVFVGALVLVITQVVPAFTEHKGRGVQVVEVLDSTGLRDQAESPRHFVSLFSVTPGTLAEEVMLMKDKDIVCGKSSVDFVSFNAKYCCQKPVDKDEELLRGGPLLQHEGDKFAGGHRVTSVRLNSGEAHRWTLAVNTTAVEGFKLRTRLFNEDEDRVVVPRGAIVGIDGWHIIQFVSDSDGPLEFHFSFFWHPNASSPSPDDEASILSSGGETQLLKLRTDVDAMTGAVSGVLDALPDWCNLFGKSTSPYTVAYLADLRVPLSS